MPAGLLTETAETSTERRGALFSRRRSHRYALWRQWSPGPLLLVVGLNPSTADAARDDPTIRRCRRFARDWGFAGLIVVNLFALRSTDPRLLRQVSPRWAVGPANDRCLRALCAPGGRAGLVLAAWGNDGALRQRSRIVSAALRGDGVALHVLGLNGSGEPVHPLYQPASAQPRPWPAEIRPSRPERPRCDRRALASGAAASG